MGKCYSLPMWALSLMCGFLVLKTSDDALPPIFEDTMLESWFLRFEVGNEIISNISLGFIVSVVFYLLVVWLPTKRKRNLIKNNYKKQYSAFKKGMIIVFLSASGKSYNSELLNKLGVQPEFKRYFKEKEQVSQSQDRWHVVLNGLEEHHLKDILMELELFVSETDYVLNNIEFKDKKVFEFLNELKRTVYRFKNSTLEYEDVKMISQFIWQIFAGWSWSEGYLEFDIIQDMIDEI